MFIRILVAIAVTSVVANTASAAYITLNQFGTFNDFGTSNIAESSTGALDVTATPKRFENPIGTVHARAEIDSVIRMSLDTSADSAFPVELLAAVREQYFLAGPEGESAEMTVRLQFDGVTQQIGDNHVNTIVLDARIGQDHSDDGGVASISGRLAEGGDNADAFEPNTHVHSGEVTHTFDAASGGEFQLAYWMRVFHRTGSEMSQFTDLTNTASVSFDVPDGFTLTSQGGFGASTQQAANPVPEPSSLALLGTAALGLIGYGWRRRFRSNAPESGY